MPVTVFPNPNDLITAVVARIKTNGLEQISGQVHQDVLLDIIVSVLSWLNSIPADVLAQYPLWDEDALYEGGTETVVRWGGKLWLFISPDDNVGTEPGTNMAIWVEVSALALAHFRNQDIYLAEGSADESSAQEIREHLDNASIHGSGQYFLDPVEDLLTAPPPFPTEGQRFAMGYPNTGGWVGRPPGLIATWTSGAWAYSADAPNGALAKCLNSSDYCVTKQGGYWFRKSFTPPPPGIYDVLGTGGNAFDRDLIMQKSILYPVQYATNVTLPGGLMLPLNEWARMVVGLMVDCEFSYVNAGDTELTIVNMDSVPHTITFSAGQWEVSNALPTTLGPGEVVVLQLRLNSVLGVMTVLSSSQVMRNAFQAVLDDDETMVAAAADRVATQRATKAHVAQAIADLVASSPGVLDTLNELAAALGDDPDFATTVTTALAGKQPLDSVLTVLAGASANGQTFVTSSNYSTMRSLLGLVIGSTVQAWSAVLDAVAGSSANVQTFLGAADYAAMRTQLGAGANNGLAQLDASGKVPASQLPPGGAPVSSVAGKLGAVVLVASDLSDISPDGENLIVAANYAAMRTQLGAGAANGLAELDASGKVPSAQLPSSIVGAVVYQTTWNAATNSPAIPAAAAGNNGYYYKVSTGVSSSHGHANVPAVDFAIGDWLISDGTAWDKVDNSESVTTVAGRAGNVVLAVADLTDMTSNGRSMAQATYSGMRTLIGLVIGSTVQAWSAVLDAVASASSDVVAFLGAADHAAMRSQLSVLDGANGAEAAYTDTPSFTAGTAPSGATNHVYNWTRVGNQVSYTIILNFATAGSTVSVLTLPLPAAMPTPKIPAGLTGASTHHYHANVEVCATLTGGLTAGTASLRRNAGNTGEQVTCAFTSSGWKLFIVSGTYYTA